MCVCASHRRDESVLSIAYVRPNGSRVSGWVRSVRGLEQQSHKIGNNNKHKSHKIGTNTMATTAKSKCRRLAQDRISFILLRPLCLSLREDTSVLKAKQVVKRPGSVRCRGPGSVRCRKMYPKMFSKCIRKCVQKCVQKCIQNVIQKQTRWPRPRNQNAGVWLKTEFPSFSSDLSASP